MKHLTRTMVREPVLGTCVVIIYLCIWFPFHRINRHWLHWSYNYIVYNDRDAHIVFIFFMSGVFSLTHPASRTSCRSFLSFRGAKRSAQPVRFTAWLWALGSSLCVALDGSVCTVFKKCGDCCCLGPVINWNVFSSLGNGVDYHT